jgi:hypothetical protein
MTGHNVIGQLLARGVSIQYFANIGENTYDRDLHNIAVERKV